MITVYIIEFSKRLPFIHRTEKNNTVLIELMLMIIFHTKTVHIFIQWANDSLHMW